MNERIRELDAQAVEYALGVCDANGLYQGKEYLQVVKEKFAELIVRECLDQIGDAIPDTNCSAADAYKTAKLAATSRVKEHFGVSE